MIDDAVERARLRSNYYRDNFRRSVAVLLFLLLIMIGLIAIIGYLLMTEVTPNDYITTSDGRIIQVTTYDTPNHHLAGGQHEQR